MRPSIISARRQKLKRGGAEFLVGNAGRRWITIAATACNSLCLYAQGVGSAALDVKDSGELHVLDLIAQRFEGALTLVDVGANVGAYAAAALTALGDRATLHCFEPNPEAFASLDRRFATVQNIYAHREALGNARGTADLYADSERSTVASLYPRSLTSTGRPISIKTQVPVTTLDEHCRAMSISTIHLLKIDAEGADFQVLQGASDMLRRGDLHAVQFEFGHNNVESRTYFRDFVDLLQAYELFRVVPRGLIRLNPYRPEQELFVSATNYLAWRRDRDVPRAERNAMIPGGLSKR